MKAYKTYAEVDSSGRLVLFFNVKNSRWFLFFRAITLRW